MKLKTAIGCIGATTLLWFIWTLGCANGYTQAGYAMDEWNLPADMELDTVYRQFGIFKCGIGKVKVEG